MTLVRKKHQITNFNDRVKEIPIEKIKVRKTGLRTNAKVSDLIESIKTVGLLNPLTISTDNELLAGGRRFAALKELGWEKVPVLIVSSTVSSDPLKEMAHLDENLSRMCLTEPETETAMARRKELYEELYPDTKKGGDRRSKTSKCRSEKRDSFVQDMSKKTGHSPKSIERAVRRDSDLSKSIKKARSDGKFNSSQVDELVKLSIEEQDQLLPHLSKKMTATELKKIVSEVQSNGLKRTVPNLKGICFVARALEKLEKAESFMGDALSSLRENTPKITEEFKSEAREKVRKVQSSCVKIEDVFNLPVISVGHHSTELGLTDSFVEGEENE